MDGIAAVPNQTGVERFLGSFWAGDQHINGVSYIARIIPESDSGVFHQHKVESLNEALRVVEKYVDKCDIYFAMATFRPLGGRKANATIGAKAIWFDIDCGEKKVAESKGYLTKSEGLNALKLFCNATGLPFPNIVVDSGHGLHVYWLLDQLLTTDEWQALSSALKAATKKLNFLADHQRTSDIASIMRVPYTQNWKDVDNPKPVILMYAKGTTPLASIQKALSQYSSGETAQILNLPNSVKPEYLRPLDTDFDGWESSMADIKPLEETAENITRVREMLGCIPADCAYPFWRDILWAVISTEWACAEQLAREWSESAPEKFTDGTFQSVVGSYDPGVEEGITFGTLVHHARQHGWEKRPFSAGAYQGGGGEWDIETGYRFAERYRGSFIYIYETGHWLKFDPRQGWLACDPAESDQAAKIVVRALRNEAAESYKDDPDGSRTKFLQRLVKHCSKMSGLHSMLESAKSEPGMSISLNQFDRDPMLLGVQNGVLDLTTGTLLPISPKIFVSKRCRSAYVPSAACPRFDQFLEEILPDPIIRAFVLKLLGYLVTGDVSEQIFIFFYGHGANGKSVLIELLAWILDDYSQHIATEMLMTHNRNPQTPSPDIVSLKGKRQAFANETADGRRLDDARVKALTGGDTLSGRLPYGKREVVFSPTHKLVMVGNHKPTITDLSQGMWRRMVLVPFEVTIPEQQRDPQLIVTLQAEAPGILNRMLEGVKAWRADGLQIPNQIRAATSEYRDEMDIMLGWLNECCTLAPPESCMKSVLYGSYKAWCTENGQRYLAANKFTRQLGDRGVTVASDKRKYLGVKLLVR